MSAAPEDTVALQSNISDQVVIELTDVNKWFGDFHVLKDINLSVNAGERIVICGPSGSGKSTLIRCIKLAPSVRISIRVKARSGST